jgi:hypothetical protein
VVRQEEVPAPRPGRRRRHAGAPDAKQEEALEEVWAAEAPRRIQILTPRRRRHAGAPDAKQEEALGEVRAAEAPRRIQILTPTWF